MAIADNLWWQSQLCTMRWMNHSHLHIPNTRQSSRPRLPTSTYVYIPLHSPTVPHLATLTYLYSFHTSQQMRSEWNQRRSSPPSLLLLNHPRAALFFISLFKHDCLTWKITLERSHTTISLSLIYGVCNLYVRVILLHTLKIMDFYSAITNEVFSVSEINQIWNTPTLRK